MEFTFSECFKRHIPWSHTRLPESACLREGTLETIIIISPAGIQMQPNLDIYVAGFLLAADASPMVSELGLGITWSPRGDPRVS